MSEQFNWLFKQRLLYIEALKAIDKRNKTQSTRANESPDCKTNTNLLIEERLIQASTLIAEFFDDSVWDLNYQMFKKDGIRRPWLS